MITPSKQLTNFRKWNKEFKLGFTEKDIKALAEAPKDAVLCWSLADLGESIRIKVEILKKWGKWMEKANRHVAKTHVGDVYISTIFLGLDYDWEFTGKPILFETMIFGGKYDGHQERYRTWASAERGHKAAVAMVRGEKFG